MEKINFTNGQEPALNDTNLNQLQDNVEEAITEVKEYVDSQIESGDGYIKFPDGTMMCFGNFKVTGVTTEAWGNIASQKVLNPVTFPSTFTEIQSVTVTCAKSEGYGFWVHRVVYNTEKIESIEISRATAVSNVFGNFSYIAMGKWK